MLASLLTLTPFTDLYQRAGTLRPIREWLCFWADFTLRLVVLVALVVLVLAVVWKTLAPFPDFWQHRGSHAS